MQQNGVNKPKPHMVKRYQETWKQEGEVILLVDANSDLDNKDFAPFIAESGLCDIIRGTHGIDTPNT
eukprot:11685804-Ditylum_brightwellii.AAC.1